MGQKGIYFPLKAVNLAHFMSFSLACSSKNLIKCKEKKPKDSATVPVQVNAHADILDSPKAKRIVSKCGKCSSSTLSTAHVQNSAESYWGGGCPV